MTLGEGLLAQAEEQGRRFDALEARFLLALAQQAQDAAAKQCVEAVLAAQDLGFVTLFGAFGKEGAALAEQALSLKPVGLRDAFALSLRRALGLEVPEEADTPAETIAAEPAAEAVAEEAAPEEAVAEEAAAEEMTAEEAVEEAEEASEEEADALEGEEAAASDEAAPKSRRKKRG